MKYLKLFENFESDEEFGDRKTKYGSFISPEGDEYFDEEEENDKPLRRSHQGPYSYNGCGCCPDCSGESDCECCSDCTCSDDDEILESLINKKNVAVNSELWSQCKSWAKSRYDVWPSAYALGAAAKRYKKKGGKWKKKKSNKK
jgi:hypothetical protein